MPLVATMVLNRLYKQGSEVEFIEVDPETGDRIVYRPLIGLLRMERGHVKQFDVFPQKLTVTLTPEDVPVGPIKSPRRPR